MVINMSTLLDFLFVMAFAYFMLLQPGRAVPVQALSIGLPESVQNTAFSHNMQMSHFDKQKRGISKNQIAYPFKQVANKAQRIRFATKEKYFELRSGMKFALGWHEEGRMFQAKADNVAEKYNNLYNAANKRRKDLIEEKEKAKQAKRKMI